jgi:hypothetical protein
VKDRRKFLRFPVKIDAHYSEEDNENWEHFCSIVNISREGMGITVYLKTNISIGCVLRFMADVPEREKPIYFTGTLNWIETFKGDPEYNYKAGIKLVLLDYAYEVWKEEQDADGIDDASSN